MPSFYFKKEVSANIYAPNGRKILADFELDGDGFIATDNGFVATEIKNAISRQIGGFVEISEAEYQEAEKKKGLSTPREPETLGSVLKERSNFLNPPVAQPVANVERGIGPPKPEPARVPTPEELRPRRGRPPKVTI